MSDRAAFLRAIAAAPEDDIPRLVYADFLDECDSPTDRARAAFIRLGCNLDSAKKRQTAAEGRFLAANWELLLPEIHRAGFTLHRRNGRICTFNRPVEISANPNFYRFTRWVHVTFWRGFAATINIWQSRDLWGLAQAAISEPLARLEIEDVTHLWNGSADILAYQLHEPPLVPKNDIWDRITSHDLLMASPGRSPIAKRFVGADAHTRARLALSDAIWGWINRDAVAKD